MQPKVERQLRLHLRAVLSSSLINSNLISIHQLKNLILCCNNHLSKSRSKRSLDWPVQMRDVVLDGAALQTKGSAAFWVEKLRHSGSGLGLQAQCSGQFIIRSFWETRIRAAHISGKKMAAVNNEFPWFWRKKISKSLR